jgi:hypothetical protein
LSHSHWAANRTDCSNCIRVCPLNKPPGMLHDLVRWGVKNTPWLNHISIKMDDLFGYGKQANPKDFMETFDEGPITPDLSVAIY